jgi:hypothetical protein
MVHANAKVQGGTMTELIIKQTCYYKVKVSADDIKNDRVLENINTHPIALCENSELQDINTEIMENKND